MRRVKLQILILGLILVGTMALPGCATRKYVRNQVGKMEPKIAEVKRANEVAIADTNERIDEVDRRAQAGVSAADQRAGVADQKAVVADQKATAALQAAGIADSKAVAADRKIDSTYQQVSNKMSAEESRMATLASYTAGESQMILFNVNSDALSNEGKQQLDALSNSVAGEDIAYLIEIHGFADATGPEHHNINLSQRRAESAQRYLVSKGMPLHRISIIGLGEERPVANNSTPQGRGQNRRVEIKVWKSTLPSRSSN